MPIRVLALESEVTTLEDHRLLVGALLGPVASAWPLDRRPGILHAGGDPGSLSGDGMTATISPMVAVVAGASSPLQGPYLVVVDEDTAVPLSDGPATGERDDPIGLVVSDSAYDGGGAVSAEVRVIGPADVSVLPLHTVTVAQGASAGTGGISWGSAVADQRTYTATHGGVIAVPDAAARDRMGALRAGTLCHVASSDALYMYAAGTWVPIAGAAFEEAAQAVFGAAPGPWSALPSGSYWTSGARWRREGDLIRWDGFIRSGRSGSPYWDLDANIAGLSIPAAARPRLTTPVVVGGQGSDSSSGRAPLARLSFAEDGQIFLRSIATETYAPQELTLTGVVYPAAGT